MSWTEAEAAAYKPPMSPYLKSLYEISGVPPTNTEGRARFLAEHALHLTRSERILIQREAKAGKHVELAILEDLAIAAHEEQKAHQKQS